MFGISTKSNVKYISIKNKEINELIKKLPVAKEGKGNNKQKMKKCEKERERKRTKCKESGRKIFKKRRKKERKISKKDKIVLKNKT